MPAVSNAIFDPTRLPPGVEREDLKNLLDLFIESMDDSLKKLEQLAQTCGTDKTLLKHEVHGQKGAAFTVGAMALAEALKTVETQMDEWSTPELLKSLAWLDRLKEQTQSTMLAALK